jgi:hypothetical protein
MASLISAADYFAEKGSKVILPESSFKLNQFTGLIFRILRKDG